MAQLNLSTPFSLDTTLCCGQVFRWNKQGEWWFGVVEGKLFKIRQVDDTLEFENIDKDDVINYFGLHDDLPKVYSKICKDKHIKQAVNTLKGLRIIRQDTWECLISYICATYKNINAIKQMLHSLSRRFGEKICYDGQEFYTFPTAEKLAKTKINKIRECGLGYRAKYVYKTAKTIHESKFDLKLLKQMPYEKAKKELQNFPGVGLKVADCVSLFSLQKFEAFPVDVWIKRVILKYYRIHFSKEFIEKISRKNSLTPTQYEQLNFFGKNYFGEYAGYAQEYLYHYERMQKTFKLNHKQHK